MGGAVRPDKTIDTEIRIVDVVTKVTAVSPVRLAVLINFAQTLVNPIKP